MQVIIDIDSPDHLSMMLWGEAKETFKAIEEAGKAEELIKLLTQIYVRQTPTLLDINNLLANDYQAVYKQLGM